MKHQPLNQEQAKEFFDAFGSLDERQKLTLSNFSAPLLAGSGFSSGTDLLHEVIIRVMDGSRAWPRHVPMGAFLTGAMRSVAGVDKRHPERRPVSWEDWMEVGDDSDFDFGNEFACTPEEMLIKRQGEDHRREVLDGAKRRLSNDKIASNILNGMEREMTPAEIRKSHGIDERGYKAARARIAKEISSHAPRQRR